MELDLHEMHHVTTIELLLLSLGFLLIAAVYSSAGFGGGSSYLAVLSVVLMDFAEIRSLALICNVVVVCGSAWMFWRAGHWSLRCVLPLVACSVPTAYFGASLQLSPSTFFGILGITLVTASLAMLIRPRTERPETRTEDPEKGAGHPVKLEQQSGKLIMESMLGGGIGFVSGLVGIGGGIFLSPTLHLMGWGHAKRIAAVASVFILFNSLSGVAGLFQTGQLSLGPAAMLTLPVAVFLGGQLGVRYCLGQTATARIRHITAALVMLAGLRILWKTFVS